MYLISEHPQGTDEWKKVRAGRATGSRASDILAKIKSGEAATRKNYRVQLVTERLTGMPCENEFSSKAMQWGIDTEPKARQAYEAESGLIVQESGFFYWPDMMVGCSVDGMIRDNGKIGLYESKCPNSATHIAYLEANRIPPEYVPQITHNLWITNADFVDFISFDPRMPANLQLFYIRKPRSEFAIDEYRQEIEHFLSDVDMLEDRLRKRAA